jgi:hypothetical protein
MVEALHDPHNIQVFKCLGIFGFSMGNEGFHQSKLAQWTPQNLRILVSWNTWVLYKQSLYSGHHKIRENSLDNHS